MVNQKKNAEPYGAPLAICLNDCEIDHGQKYQDLAAICFKLNCAFATMRWGSLEEMALNTRSNPPQRALRLVSNNE